MTAPLPPHPPLRPHAGDPHDPRASSLLQKAGRCERGDFVFVGLPYDSSIATRRGASSGPTALREALPSLTTFGAEIDLAGRTCKDLGDLDLPESIRDAHQLVESFARSIFEAGALPFFAGGDNSLTGSVIRGLAAARPDLRLGLVIIDSHYDVREYESEDSLSSGTPYRRALETSICAGARTFILGTRDFANSAYYDQYVREQGITTVAVDEFDAKPAREIAARVRSSLESSSDAIFLSIDIDAVELPGSSAAAPGTLMPREAIAIVREIASSRKLIAADLSELSPPWDVENMTAKMAARLFLEVMAGVERAGSPPAAP
jgi:formiminoglutamase